jgi:hypothetical protein
MSATTVPTQPSSGATEPTDMAAWLGRTLVASEVAVFLFEHAADQPRTRRAADRGHRQYRHNPVGAPGGATPPAGCADLGFGGDQVAAAPIRASSGW